MMQVCDPARLTTYIPGRDPYRRWEFQLVEGDERHRVPRLEGRGYRVIHTHEAVYLAAATGLYRIQLKTLAILATRPRGMLQLVTLLAVLDQQLACLEPLPEEGGILVNPDSWT